MIIMPMSDYPTSSDPVSRMQALSEKKGEISQEMQDVQDSNLDEKSKAAVTDSLSQQSDDVSAQIRHKQSEKAVDDKLKADQSQKKKIENAALEKQDADTNSKKRLDTHA